MDWLNSLRPSDTYICVSKLGHYCFRWWFVALSGPGHYLNKWWIIVKQTTCSIKFYLNFKSFETTKGILNFLQTVAILFILFHLYSVIHISMLIVCCCSCCVVIMSITRIKEKKTLMFCILYTHTEIQVNFTFLWQICLLIVSSACNMRWNNLHEKQNKTKTNKSNKHPFAINNVVILFNAGQLKFSSN